MLDNFTWAAKVTSDSLKYRPKLSKISLFLSSILLYKDLEQVIVTKLFLYQGKELTKISQKEMWYLRYQSALWARVHEPDYEG